jgi:hypothetical protein
MVSAVFSSFCYSICSRLYERILQFTTKSLGVFDAPAVKDRRYRTFAEISPGVTWYVLRQVFEARFKAVDQWIRDEVAAS